MPTKIYDCSNSPFRPPHRQESLGPTQNDIMASLKKYCADYDCVFVEDPNEADAIITNDVFPPDILALNKPMIKRMDGVFWDEGGKRNELLNIAAQQADYVIFISGYSAASYYKMYGQDLKYTNVVLNEVDGNVFYPEGLRSKRFMWAASASNWARHEKRFPELIKFAKLVEPLGQGINLIGKCDMDVPKNVIKHGYLSEDEIRNVLNKSAAFVNLSYRDAAPKAMCQAISCHLPVLYANSGGAHELCPFGIQIKEKDPISYKGTDPVFEDKAPEISKIEMDLSLSYFILQYHYISYYAQRYQNRHKRMLGKYFDIIKETANEKS